jgi:WhiB family redox-sensing transcriptional regulator
LLSHPELEEFQSLITRAANGWSMIDTAVDARRDRGELHKGDNKPCPTAARGDRATQLPRQFDDHSTHSPTIAANRLRRPPAKVVDATRLPGAIGELWEWQLQAACRGMDISIFYHPKGEQKRAREGRIADAKATCNTCPVMRDCREHALSVREPYGIWGGLSEYERADLLGVSALSYSGLTVEKCSDQATEPNRQLSGRG